MKDCEKIPPDEFYTMKGYDMLEEPEISPAMEDYLEMICRCSEEIGYIRMNTLSAKLHVKPSSASKMVLKLKEQDMVHFEHYGIITPSAKGWELGRYLLYRHKVLHEFFCLLNHSDNELQEVEQIEHYISANTVQNLESLTKRLKKEGD